MAGRWLRIAAVTVSTGLVLPGLGLVSPAGAAAVRGGHRLSGWRR
jgi:hypothetical protein